ncbi:type I-F CRISPR-associated endoribonuclease Cas6/Csy4 [Aliivibrio fischeri]|uniref:type I-F CRISPR-associated endoribonuclease Cas6/Csy4 n=1 Tax=Aliivibrio fischeri TaxID=668 RepID=UPI00080EDB57|nr:type I-F CRISPR-associated endoribonuclease Cas6/Csy4 [Aliivibrio fischeri]MUH95714.1 type I-F CRISPR-associated endoribonuclease Cas6/Csy4 [Aliivibrio fischeri]MUI63007.1 type I-F CRISPR-associated endoribonuclease Cas6/Csy4 [Aliivibrio fischeri]OCH41143.1 type I-F CRISPR-associated endoribonuclease Cas6/Csy4 [Aliivibrio fischeri]OED51318.1 type I-F CRISPR-associated endoribonuclease Cas6/Csy4 [Aliivibrio fischeri]OED56063.1 type I-F CRISPR-associated endoribonuclease Cas6/Csy4 [Aliivibrio
MDCYIEIILKPDAEMRENVLLNKVYTKLHKALVTLNSDSIGVSFPQYNVILGRVIRIHSNSAMLHDLNGVSWLGGLIGYCNVSEITVVPSSCEYRIISRIQSTMSQSKLKRLIKRGSISEEEEKTYKAKMFSKGLDNPYLELESSSNGYKHRRYLRFSAPQSEPIQGKFDQFGLSKSATVPWF